MSKLPPCADGFNNPGDEHFHLPSDYVTRPGGQPDEGIAFEDDDALHRAVLAELHEEQSIDCGDDAVNALAFAAEARLRQAFPDVDGVIIIREQERFSSNVFGAEFTTRWRVRLSGSHSATGITLDAAVDAVMAEAAGESGVVKTVTPAALVLMKQIAG